MNKQENKANTPSYFPIAALTLLTIILNSCVLSPLYTQLESDITMMYTVVPIIIEKTIILFDIIYISLICAMAACAVYGIYKRMNSKSEIIIYVSALIFLKHALNLAVSSIIDGYIDVAFDIPATLLVFFADVLLVIIVALISNSKCKHHFIRAEKMRKAAKYIETVEFDEEAGIYPFSKLLDLKNPILYSVFAGAVISTALLVIQRLFADFVVIGAPDSFFELFEIAIEYLIDIIFGISAYLLSYFASSYILARITGQNQ